MTPAYDYRGSDSREFNFYSEPETPHERYVDGITESMPDFEPATIQTEIEQIEAYANDPLSQALAIADSSQYEAQIAARLAERQEAANREAMVVYAKGIGERLNYERDYEQADSETKRGWDLAA